MFKVSYDEIVDCQRLVDFTPDKYPFISISVIATDFHNTIQDIRVRACKAHLHLPVNRLSKKLERQAEYVSYIINYPSSTPVTASVSSTVPAACPIVQAAPLLKTCPEWADTYAAYHAFREYLTGEFDPKYQLLITNLRQVLSI